MKSDSFLKVVSASVLGSMLSVKETVAFGGGYTKSGAVNGKVVQSILMKELMGAAMRFG